MGWYGCEGHDSNVFTLFDARSFKGDRRRPKPNSCIQEVATVCEEDKKQIDQNCLRSSRLMQTVSHGVFCAFALIGQVACSRGRTVIGYWPYVQALRGLG